MPETTYDEMEYQEVWNLERPELAEERARWALDWCADLAHEEPDDRNPGGATLEMCEGLSSDLMRLGQVRLGWREYDRPWLLLEALRDMATQVLLQLRKPVGVLS